jgi:hypothetical protein
MPQKIPREVRASVIRDWLSGKPRDTIAHDNMVSARCCNLYHQRVQEPSGRF